VERHGALAVTAVVVAATAAAAAPAQHSHSSHRVGVRVQTDADGDTGRAAAAQLPQLRRQKALFLQYGYYVDERNATEMSNHTLELIVPGADSMLVVDGNNMQRLSSWAQTGGKFAWALPRSNRYYSLEAHLGQGNHSFGVELAATYVESWYARGFEFVALDELGNLTPDWQDGGAISARFVSWLERMAADGYDQRVIVYWTAYNTFGLDIIGNYSQILRACVKHCRAMGSEIYIYTQDIVSPRGDAPYPGECFRNISCLTRLAEQFEALGSTA
jgi:hypothetical protein